MVLLLMWISCSVFCYFIMRSKGYPNDKCWAHCIGGFLLGVIWLIVCLVKKPVERPMDLPPNSLGSERNYAIEQIGKLAQLRDSGAISITEYEEKKKELLKQI